MNECMCDECALRVFVHGSVVYCSSCEVKMMDVIRIEQRDWLPVCLM